MHVLLEETIEVLHHVVAKERGDRADLGGWEDAQQPPRMSEPCFNLALHHRYSVFVKESSLERSHLCAEFSGDGLKAQLHVSVQIKDEMMRSACGALKKRGIEAISRRCSHCPDLSNDLNLDRRQLAGGAACHSCSLQAEGRLSANERRDIGAVQSPRRDACQWKQKTILSAKTQSLTGACCLYETSGGKT
jgi:hypothetical protein